MTSMLESTPKPTRATLPASRPAPMATTPSMTFQPTVKYSSHRARRCSPGGAPGTRPRSCALLGRGAGAMARTGPDRLAGHLEDPVGGGQDLGHPGHEPVVDLTAVALAGDQAAVPQTGQVGRDIGLSQAGRLHHV